MDKVGKNSRAGRSAARNYADFVQASMSAQEDDETGFRKSAYFSEIERHRTVLDLLRRMEMPVTKAQIGTAFADHLTQRSRNQTSGFPISRESSQRIVGAASRRSTNSVQVIEASSGTSGAPGRGRW